MNPSKINKVMKLCYVEIYNKSIPPADFNVLLDNAPVNIRGQREIKYNEYEIKEETFNEIVNRICKDYKVTKNDKKRILTSLYLGATPVIVDRTLFERRIDVINKIKKIINKKI